MEDLTLEERVQNGIDWLNENHPGWREHIDLEALDLSYGCNCVLGQTFHEKVNLEDTWELGTKFGVFDGFDYAYTFYFNHDPSTVISLGFDGHSREEYESLQKEWMRVLEL